MTKGPIGMTHGMGVKRLEALRWLADNGPTCWFGQDTPPFNTIKWLKKAGYVATGRTDLRESPRHPFSPSAFFVSPEGHKLLRAANPEKAG